MVINGTITVACVGYTLMQFVEVPMEIVAISHLLWVVGWFVKTNLEFKQTQPIPDLTLLFFSPKRPTLHLFDNQPNSTSNTVHRQKRSLIDYNLHL